jgi:D-alanyl-D-alanine carboxypeptidase
MMIEANESELVVVGEYRQSGRQVKMRTDAAAALKGLFLKAGGDGLQLVPISGFRTVAYQEMLYKKAIEKYGSEELAMRWVARPGTSEHHTGLAIDLGSQDDPTSDVETSFETTGAFQWLVQNAGLFGFEMSYPKNNSRGINYEPWHWRFIGTPEAKQIFQR